MISSMTGYGLSSSIEGGSEITIEIKGVNNKFLEILSLNFAIVH